MNSSAIHQAIRLSKYPKEMAWLCQSSATLPEGITELLRLSSSDEKIALFAEKFHTKAESLQKILLSFINQVLLNENNADEKILGLNDKSDAEQRKLHYQLLLKIYHPDKNASADAAYQTARITKAYQNMKTQEVASEYKNIRISRVPPKSFYHATTKAEQQISNVKSAFIAMLAVTVISAIWIGRYLYEPASPELFSHNSNNTSEPPVFEELQSPTSSPFSMAASTANTDQAQLQQLLATIETAYEQGNAAKIQTILNSPEIKQQPDKEVFAKLKNLFKITSDRKMLLYDFEWTNLSGQIAGKGKFLSRYYLNGENQWLTREGIASIIATRNNKNIDITSLKLDNKNIDQ